MSDPLIILVAGPTASGKSALAMSMARAMGGEIVGADSMQLYRDLPILTAAPTLADQAEIPHHLVGVADASQVWSVGRWLASAQIALADIAARDKPAIVVGGTGLCFHALTKGLADIPPVNRAPSEALHESDLRDDLYRLDPAAEHRIEAGDRQRLIRAHAVATQTGRSLSDWQASTTPFLPEGAWRGLVVEPERDVLYGRCDARLAAMLDDDGLLAEIAALTARNLDPVLPAMKTLGYRELAAHLRGETSLKDALAAAQGETRRYAKRQLTWFRNQTPDWVRVSPEA